MSSTADEPGRNGPERNQPERDGPERDGSEREGQERNEQSPPTDPEPEDEPGTTREPDAAAEERRLRPWHWRRLLRGRVRPLLAAGLAGLLLGVSGTAWQTQSWPFTPDEMCWGALSRDDLAPILRDPDGVEAVEVPVLDGEDSNDGPHGTCQLTNSDGDEWAITARVHPLDHRADSDGGWADEFLAARLTPLGGGLLGMASDNRAWLALPDSCGGRSGGFDSDGPVVVDIADGDYIPEANPGTAERDAMARMVVKLANKISGDMDCAGTIADPVERLPKPARYDEFDTPDALCGIEGLTDGSKEAPYQKPLITKGDGPVRTCDRAYSESRPAQRMMTVEDDRLAGIFVDMGMYHGERVRATHGKGGISANLGVFRTRCQEGRVVFLVQSREPAEGADLRKVFPRYVEAEAARLGCSPLKVRLPRPNAGR